MCMLVFLLCLLGVISVLKRAQTSNIDCIISCSLIVVVNGSSIFEFSAPVVRFSEVT
jgi:hypothetical protein